MPKPGRPAATTKPGRPAAMPKPGRPAATTKPGRPAAMPKPGRLAATTKRGGGAADDRTDRPDRGGSAVPGGTPVAGPALAGAGRDRGAAARAGLAGRILQRAGR